MEIRVDKKTLLAIVLIGIGVTLRLLPHTANFAPIGAIALFAGAVMSWRTALWLPLLTMILSDIVIGFYPGILFTWSGFMLVSLFGMTLRNQPNSLRISLGAIGSAFIFFVVSNFGVFIEGRLYPLSWQGFISCYAMAIPFLKTSFLADLFYSALFFGLYALASKFAQGSFVVWPHKTTVRSL